MRHVSVLLNETISALNLKPGLVVLDGTVGSGGHSEAILNYITPTGLLIGIDQDEDALQRAGDRLKSFGSAVILRKSNFRDLDQVLRDIKVSEVDAVLLDIGVSKEQISTAERGFSFLNEGPLDMRMDPAHGRSASDLVNQLAESKLADIFYQFGEERHSRSIARWIVEERRKNPFHTTTQLADLIKQKVPARVRFGRIHPATRVFQALRIAVNDELGALTEGLEKAIRAVKSGGRIGVITFHSLEDRIVKHRFQKGAREDELRIITKKPVIPTDDEIERNPNSRSAKLRVAEKVSKSD